MKIDDLREHLSSGADAGKEFKEVSCNLTEREGMILRMRLGTDSARPKTVDEVAQELGRSRDMICWMQRKALMKVEANIQKDLKSASIKEG